MPDFIETVKLVQAVTLLLKQEPLVWGKLPTASPLSEGSAVLVEPSKTQTRKKNIIVSRSVASMNGERWIPVRNLNTSKEAVSLKHHTKVADVSSCIAIEDLDVTSEQTPIAQVRAQNQTLCGEAASGPGPPLCPSFRGSLHNLRLDDLDIDSCEMPDHWKSQLLQLVQKYEDKEQASLWDG